MDCEVIFQIISCNEDLLTNWTGYWVRVFLISMPAELLSSLAHKLTLITVEHVMTRLVSRQLAVGLHLFVTNITSYYHPLNVSRVNFIDVRANMTYSFVTFCTVKHILEVDSHV